MATVCMYFQVHQPFRLRRYSVFDTNSLYFDETVNAKLCRKIAKKCYLPAIQCMFKQLKQHEGRFRFAYSITGVVLEQSEA